MTKDKKRKRAVREAALTTGRRYAAQARTMAAVQRVAEFPLAALLAECAAREPAVVEWDFPAEFAPEVFESSLLGTALPYGSVMQLAGRLSQEGRNAMLIVESVAPLYEVVVACGKRRFYLTVTQEAAWELCQAPACQGYPSQEVFTHCTQHLVQCDEQALVRMGNRWASDHREAFRDAPALAGGSTDADELVRAAVHDGVTLEVTRAIADSLFGDPDMFDEVYHYEDESTLTAVRKAYAAELQRLLMEGQFEQNRLRGSRELCVECKVRRLGFDSLAPALLCEQCVQKRHECTNREESLRYG